MSEQNAFALERAEAEEVASRVRAALAEDGYPGARVWVTPFDLAVCVDGAVPHERASKAIHLANHSLRLDYDEQFVCDDPAHGSGVGL